MEAIEATATATTLVNAITIGGPDLAVIGVLVREARSMSLLHFDHALFTSCRRQCNKVAHTLAKAAYDNNVPTSSWVYVAPPDIIGLVASDIAVQQV